MQCTAHALKCLQEMSCLCIISLQICPCCISHTLARSPLPVLAWRVQVSMALEFCFPGELDPITLRPFPQPIVQLPAQVSPLETSSSQNQMRPWRPQRHSSDGKLSGWHCLSRSSLLAYCIGSKCATGVYILGLVRLMLQCYVMWLMQHMTQLLDAGHSSAASTAAGMRLLSLYSALAQGPTVASCPVSEPTVPFK